MRADRTPRDARHTADRTPGGTALVIAAQSGDRRAREDLAAAWLPLVYNVVGRALGGHPDVDDVVQETMLRAVDNLPALRDPAAFRSWLVAIAMNQVRTRAALRREAAVPGLDDAWDLPDPGGDFVDLTILRLGLSGQRREVAEATRWLDEDDRALLALWWLEASGDLTRPELAEALGVTPQHAAVRVQRMKEQLSAARVVVRALGVTPRCAEIETMTRTWDGHPAAIWRKRIARHARGCTACGGHWTELIPAEGLLASMPLLLPAGWSAAAGGAGTLGAAAAGGAAGAHAAGSAIAAGTGAGTGATVAGAAGTGAAAGSGAAISGATAGSGAATAAGAHAGGVAAGATGVGGASTAGGVAGAHAAGAAAGSGAAASGAAAGSGTAAAAGAHAGGVAAGATGVGGASTAGGVAGAHAAGAAAGT
ncbi:RNA polymerase sigma factor, partial [Yinghuangia seranimata]|uniref:RNA polymerase sigma factor n=1 Tax=Yinghuangia seranimata TaxID=408067 RepID=UPI00248BCF60